MTMTLKLPWEDLRATWVRSGAILGQPGVILGLSWEDLGATWVHLGPSWGYLERTWRLIWSNAICLKCPNRFRSAFVQRKHLHHIMQVHTEQRQIWETLTDFICFISFFF